METTIFQKQPELALPLFKILKKKNPDLKIDKKLDVLDKKLREYISCCKRH